MAEPVSPTVAVVQMASGADKARNVARAVELTAKAADTGASIIALPETFDYRGDAADLSAIAEPLPGSALEPLMFLAKERRVWIVAGSIHESEHDGGMPFNTSVLIDPEGRIAAKYRKIHLFDISIGDRSVTESAKYRPGDRVVHANAAGARIGLTICYDLRFPELYRALADVGTDIVFIPSSFTAPTGRPLEYCCVPGP